MPHVHESLQRDPKGRFMPLNDNVSSQDTNAGDSDQSQTEFVGKHEIAAIVNAAVSSHLKRSLSKEITAALEGALKPIKERLDAPQPEPQADKTASKGPSPEVAALEKKLSD